jgi:hypothetical protein
VFQPALAFNNKTRHNEQSTRIQLVIAEHEQQQQEEEAQKQQPTTKLLKTTMVRSGSINIRRDCDPRHNIFLV